MAPPPDPLAWNWREFRPHPAQRKLYARIRFTAAEMHAAAKHGRGAFVEACRQEWAAAAAGIKADLENVLAVDAGAIHGMVEHHGLIVPKHTPREVWADQWVGAWDKARMYGEFVDREGKPAGWVKADEPVYYRQARPEPSDVEGLGIVRVPEPDPLKNYHGITRRKW